MIISTTFNNKEASDLIDSVLGNSFSFYKTFKMGGKGSKRMLIEDTSENIRFLLNKVSDVNYSNIELRPNGIIVMINKGLQNFQWIIPYAQLVVYKTDRLSIHAQGKFISFKNNVAYKENKKFIDKMTQFKADYQEKYSMPIRGKT